MDAVLLVVVLLISHTIAAPMSPCIVRSVAAVLFCVATPGWEAPTLPNGGAQGTCGIGVGAEYLPSWYTARYIAAPDDETYNGYPWLSPPVTTSDTGLGKSCGECFEITGELTTIQVMVASVCVKQLENCQGSLGGPLGPPDVPDFDIENSIFPVLTNGGANIPIAFRKVSCDMGTTTVGLGFDDGPSSTYFVMHPFGMVVGIESVEVRGTAGGGTGGNWMHLVRGWQGSFEWSGRGDIGAPWEVRVTSILGDTITFNQSLSPPYPSVISSGLQFPEPSPGYGGSVSTACPWPGPDPVLYVSGFGGPYGIKWRDWGSYVTGNVTYNVTTGCHTSPCIKIGPSGPYEALQIGNTAGAPVHYWENITFWIRSNNPTSLSVYWTGSNQRSISIGSSWTFFSLKNVDFWDDPSSGSLKVFQIQTKSATTADIYVDDIQLMGQNFSRLIPIIGGLDGPPPVGDAGYTGPDPYTGQPTPPITTPPPTTPPPTTPPPTSPGGLPSTPVTDYIEIIGDVQLLPNSTLQISLSPNGGGYLNVTGCAVVQGSLNITVNNLPTPGANISFLESPCITNSGSSIVIIDAPGNDGCSRVEGAVDFTDSTHLGVLFSEISTCERNARSALSKAALAGIVVGTIVVVGAATAIALIVFKKAKYRDRATQRTSRRAWNPDKF